MLQSHETKRDGTELGKVMKETSLDFEIPINRLKRLRFADALLAHKRARKTVDDTLKMNAARAESFTASLDDSSLQADVPKSNEHLAKK